MNIAIFTNNYLPNPFGVSGSIESFRKQFEKMGHTVYVFAPKAKGYVDENKNVFRYPAIDLTFRGIRFPLAIPFSFGMHRILRDLEIDIVHSQHPNLLGWAAKGWAKKKKIPLVFTWHTLYDQYTHFVPFFVPRNIANWWTIRNARSYADKADMVITPTESVKKIIMRWGVKNENIKAIPTGIDGKLFAEVDRALLRKKYGISTDDVVLVLVSRMTQEKNVGFVFRAVAKILKERGNVCLVSSSRGNLVDELREYAKKENIGGKVFFVEENEKVLDMYAAGDIFAYASKSETQGMVVTEAMMSGLPVVAVAATGISDQVMDGASGFLVDEDEGKFAKAVEKLIEDKELRKRFSENAKKIALENYTSEICAGRMLEVYKKAIENK